MSRSVSKKIFFLTSLFLILFISLTFVFQTVFFQKFYLKRKESNLKNNLVTFMKVYKENASNGQDNLTTIKNFEEKTSSKIGILDESGQLKFVTTFNDEKKDSNEIASIRRIVKDLILSKENLFNISEGTIKTYIFDTYEYDIKNLVLSTKVKLSTGETQVILVVTSLQSVDEVIIILREYYIYVYIVALIFIIFLSLIYSKTISKPLKRLNKVASKYALLDFSEKCKEKSKDEIGNLSDTLNFLSENLQSSLLYLKDTNDKLKEDIVKEKKIEEVRKEFVTSVSHELKTPISLISGYAEGIKDNIASEEERDYYIEVILDEANKMSNMVNDMLELSKLESGVYSLKLEVFFLDELLDGVLKKFSSPCEKEGISIKKDYDIEIKVTGDRKKIEQVIVNLLTNAISHSFNGGYIKAFIEKEEDKVKVGIFNEGNPIPKDDIEKIWDKFYKVDKSRNRGQGGTGLGLSIVKNILELHKSNYGVVNSENGVLFYFYLDKWLDKLN